MQKISIKPEHLKQIKALLKDYIPNSHVWAYGSRLSGKCHEGSDLDLVIRNEEDLKTPLTDKLLDLKQALSESNIPFLVDVIDWAALPESFHREILKNYIVIQPQQKDI